MHPKYHVRWIYLPYFPIISVGRGEEWKNTRNITPPDGRRSANQKLPTCEGVGWMNIFNQSDDAGTKGFWLTSGNMCVT